MVTRFNFFENGTTKAGRIAYGGEFTLNNGPVDTAAWQANTNNGFSHKSGLGYLVYKLSPDRKDAGKRMKLHLSNIDAAYKDMTDGHACALVGFTWGLAGVYASDDARLKKKISDYYKAWLNLARCHGSDSYIILPGRDYADYSYYRDNIRNHTTSAVAFIYSFSTPKLRVHGRSGDNARSAHGCRLAQPASAQLRAFHNTDRSKSIEASLVAFDPASGRVKVRLRNGGIRELPIDSLSQEDQEYVRKESAGQR